MYNLFISHSWAHGDAYDRLIDLLNAKQGFAYKNYSVPKNDPIHNARNEADLYRIIKSQIQPVQVVIILAGVYSTYSKWINHEITISKKEFSKPILAIEPWASERTSLIVKQAADKIVAWNTDSIVSGIKALCP